MDLKRLHLLMNNKIVNYLQQMRSLQHINMALSRGAATSALRQIELSNPASWEFCGFSQNGEDGIIDILSRQLKTSNRYFIEIGASNGLENNTTWLALAMRWNGIWIEGDTATSQWCRRIFTPLNYGVESLCLFVNKDNVTELAKSAIHMNPDLFSLDIDGNDYYLAEVILNAGFKPKIFIVEYNSTFGPEESLSIPYQDEFRRGNNQADDLYYGCSISAWKYLFQKWGYRFVTTDLNGVNAVFIDPTQFGEDFVKGICGTTFRENFAQLRQHKVPWQKQFDLIKDREFMPIN